MLVIVVAGTTIGLKVIMIRNFLVKFKIVIMHV